jgi:hypothetical protein
VAPAHCSRLQALAAAAAAAAAVLRDHAFFACVLMHACMHVQQQENSLAASANASSIAPLPVNISILRVLCSYSHASADDAACFCRVFISHALQLQLLLHLTAFATGVIFAVSGLSASRARHWQ